MVEDFAAAVAAVDARAPVGQARRFKPGVGPLTETELTNALLEELGATRPARYYHAGPLTYPGSRYTCDVVVPGEWALELKLARPFGDNGRPAERWSENLLYPYPGNTSSIGDCLKLLDSEFKERKGIIVVGYEHDPPKILLEPAIQGFEVLANTVMGIRLSGRAAVSVSGLIHPFHQCARVYGWEILGRV